MQTKVIERAPPGWWKRTWVATPLLHHGHHAWPPRMTGQILRGYRYDDTQSFENRLIIWIPTIQPSVHSKLTQNSSHQSFDASYMVTKLGIFGTQQVLLQKLGLLDMFPYLRQGLSGENLEPAAQNPGKRGCAEHTLSPCPLTMLPSHPSEATYRTLTATSSLISFPLGASYLTYISQLNQVVMMSTQLYHDACVPQHHKYCAHQIALLYVSLSSTTVDA